MNNLMSSLLPADWLAVGFFAFAWIGYSWFSAQMSKSRNSLSSMLSLYRRDWMYQLLRRELRIHDVTLVGGFERNCAFFASSALLILAGLLSLLGYAPEATAVFERIHQPIALPRFVTITLLLAGIFTYTFFVFTWSMRQFGFVGIMIVSAPTPNTRSYSKRQREEFSDHCARIADLASVHFNHGLRAYYFALAVLGWYFSPLVFIIFTSAVVLILYQREFASRAGRALRLAHKDIDPHINELDDNQN